MRKGSRMTGVGHFPETEGIEIYSVRINGGLT